MQEFKKAAADVRNLDKTPSNEDYAKMYGLFKQASVGDCDRGAFDIVPTGRPSGTLEYTSRTCMFCRYEITLFNIFKYMVMNNNNNEYTNYL